MFVFPQCEVLNKFVETLCSFADAKEIKVNILRHYPLDDDLSDCWEERTVRLRSEKDFEVVFSKNYGSLPVKDDTVLTRFEDLVDGQTYLVSSSTTATVSTIENAVLRRNKDFEKKVCFSSNKCDNIF